MDKHTVQRILNVQEILLQDSRYQQLNREYSVRSRALSSPLKALPEGQRETLEDYLGLCAEMHLRMLEIACREG